MLRQRALIAWVVSVSLVAVMMLPASAMALTRREGDTVTIAKGETISDDLYLFGSNIAVDGTVDGDVVAFGQNVVINGDVRGSVITAAQTVRVGGTVGGSVRAAGATVDIGGKVGTDLLAGASNVMVGGTVGRDVAAGAQNVAITGTVGRDLMVGSSSLLIAGTVGGNVHAESTNVTVANTGSVAGSLDYWSATAATVLGSVSGATSRHQPTTQEAATGGGGVARTLLAAVVAWTQSLIGFAVLGLVAVFAFRSPMERGSRAVHDRLGVSLGVGALAFFATPMVVGFLFVFGLFVGAWWLSFVLIMVYSLLLLAGVIVGSLAVGRAILQRLVTAAEPALAWSVLLGLFLVWIVAAVPFLGWLVGWAVTVTGAGALVLLMAGKAEKPPVPAPAVAGPSTTTPPMAPSYTQPSH